METSVPSARPRKRRRHNRALREDDVETADAIIVQSVMHETEQGPVEEFTRIPTWTNRPRANNEDEEVQQIVGPRANNEDEEIINHDNHELPGEIPHVQDDDSAQGTPRNRKVSYIMHTCLIVKTLAQTQQYYLQQFVDRVHPMLQALLSREALPRNSTCRQCAAGHAARWRCKDCTGATLMCRCCMRQSHIKNPLHRVVLLQLN